jgi:hypothetical protein
MFSAAIKTAAAAGGYQISRSLRFNSADSAYLARTFPSAGNQKTWTWSAWLKLSAFGSLSTFFERRTGLSDATIMSLLIGDGSFGTTKDALVVARYSFYNLITTQVFRDPSAWYHIVLNVDTTQATSSNRMKLYVNGQQITAFSSSTYPSLNEDLPINAAAAHDIGRANFFNGYMTEVNFIDGQALTPSSFGQTNAQTGVWEPVAYSGSYGTNGFYLNFSDNSNTTAATLGKDYSGNGNNWTPNNFSVSAGAGNDSLVDSPTSYGTDTGAGGSVRGNYCTLNPLIQRWLVNTATFSNGNLDTANTNASNAYVFGTTSVNSGKYYWEITVTNIGSSAIDFLVGVDSGLTQSSIFSDIALYAGNGNKYVGSTSGSAYGATYTTNDVIGVALDKDAGTITFYKNGASQGSINLPTSVSVVPFITPGLNSGSATANFGQRPFAYTAPSGFRALNTQNLPTPTIGATSTTQASSYFAPTIYTGNGANNRTITTGLQSDFVWIKNRSNVAPHLLFDVIRGAGQTLYSNLTSAEINNGTSYVQQFNSNNFLLGVVDGSVNGSGENYVSWVWRANGAGSSNTAGSITSTVSANTTSGFSVVTYTGTGSNATIGHGLGVAPRMIIVKRRNGVDIWPVYHESIGNTQYLRLQGDNQAGTFNVWQNTSPTSSVFYISTDSTVNTNTGTYVAYCFAPIAGYSAFGSYTGNGSTDGPFIFTGFRPRYVMIKASSSVTYGNWILIDTARSPYNVTNNNLYANASNAEDSTYQIDVLSNGFKIRHNTFDGINGNGSTYIYAVFAEFPFKYSLAR